MSDLKFYNKQDKEELVSMCMARDNKINNLEQENKQLKKHHICVRPYTNDKVREKIDNYKDTIKQLSKIIIDKQQKIDKAIEKVKDIWFTLSGDKFYTKVILKDTESGKELLKILGGKENDNNRE